MIGAIHLWASVTALITGGILVLRPKGVGLHKIIGRLYFASMVLTLATALSIYKLFDGFGPFHVAAIVSAVSITAGVIPAWRRKPLRYWVAHHAMWMSWSYVGLCAAAVSEISTRYLRLNFGWTVAIATLFVVSVGFFCIRIRMPMILRKFGI